MQSIEKFKITLPPELVESLDSRDMNGEACTEIGVDEKYGAYTPTSKILNNPDERYIAKEIKGEVRSVRLTHVTLMKIEMACKLHYTQKQVAAFAGISIHTLRAFFEKYPNLQDWVDRWKEFSAGGAKGVLVEKIFVEKDANVSKWWLSKVEPETFGNKVEVNSTSLSKNITVTTTIADIEKLKQIRNSLPRHTTALPDDAKDTTIDID